MAFNFDEMVNRKNTRSYKWDQVGPLFGDENILPLWVADMDFASPPEVRDVLIKRAELGAYGYAIRPSQYFTAITGWFQRRHNWSFEEGWIVDVPSVVTTLSLSVELFSKPGDQVVLQTPVYYPFYDVIEGNNRVIARNPLVIRNNRYEMDLAHLESLFQGGAKLMLLCNPHNPGGRVWTKEELKALGDLALKYNVTVVSDEIHCDLTFPGEKFTPFASLSPEIADITITALAPTKTFNLPGLHTSFALISNKEMRTIFDKKVKLLSIHMANHFAQDAVIAAYNDGDKWLDELMQYVKGNSDYAIQYLAEHLPLIKPLHSEGTYLLWIDCRAYGKTSNEWKQLMWKEAKVAFNEGSMFGEEGQGWLRINLACTREILEQALKQFATALNQ